jgi:hypothetical protein
MNRDWSCGSKHAAVADDQPEDKKRMHGHALMSHVSGVQVPRAWLKQVKKTPSICMLNSLGMPMAQGLHEDASLSHSQHMYYACQV